MPRSDWTLKSILVVIALLLGLIAVRPLFDPGASVLAQPARFDHVYIVSAGYLYKGQQGLLVMDRRNANVWFLPRTDNKFQNPVFVFQVPFDKLDQAPQ